MLVGDQLRLYVARMQAARTKDAADEIMGEALADLAAWWGSTVTTAAADLLALFLDFESQHPPTVPDTERKPEELEAAIELLALMFGLGEVSGREQERAPKRRRRRSSSAATPAPPHSAE